MGKGNDYHDHDHHGHDHDHDEDVQEFSAKKPSKVKSFDSDVLIHVEGTDGGSIAIASSKKELKQLMKSNADVVYDEKKGKLYLNDNGSKKGWGKKKVGGLLAKFKGKPELNADHFEGLSTHKSDLITGGDGGKKGGGKKGGDIKDQIAALSDELGDDKMKAVSRRFVTNGRRILGTGIKLSASIGIGDLNGDGTNDLVVANGRHWPQQNYLFFNQGRGAAVFNVQRPLGLNLSTSYAAKPADLDGDGDLDIAVGNDMAPNRIFMNDGKGAFSESGSFGEISSLRGLTLADIDNDGDIDILIPCRGRPNQIALNDGSGVFPDTRTFGNKNHSTIDVAVVDWNGDQHLDLVLANRMPHPNVILLNNGHGKYSKRQKLDPSSDRLNSRAVAIADMNGDKNPDIVIGNIGATNQIYFGDGKGGIIKSQVFGSEDGQTYAIISGDIDNDGDVDLIVGNRASYQNPIQRNAVYVNQGEGNMFDVIPFGDDDDATYGVSAADLDQDGFLDLVVANSGDLNSFFLNQ